MVEPIESFLVINVEVVQGLTSLFLSDINRVTSSHNIIAVLPWEIMLLRSIYFSPFLFSLRGSVENIFVIGDGKSPAISLPKGEGIKLSLIEERDARIDDEDEGDDDEDDN